MNLCHTSITIACHAQRRTSTSRQILDVRKSIRNYNSVNADLCLFVETSHGTCILNPFINVDSVVLKGWVHFSRFLHYIELFVFI